MSQTKTLQHLRNSTVYASLSAAQTALQDSTFMSKRSDGEMVLARYNKTENNATVIKTLVGIYHKSGNNVSCTFLTEVNQDTDHMTISLEDAAYWDDKQDELISGTNIKTVDGNSLLGSGNVEIKKVIIGEYRSSGTFYPASIIGGSWVFLNVPVTGNSDILYVDISGFKIYWYDSVSSEYIDFSTDLIPIVTVASTGAVTQALSPNKFYKFTGDTTLLKLTFNAGTGLSVYAGKFTADTNGCVLQLPDTIHEAVGNPKIEGGKTYEFNVADNVLILMEV